MLLLKEFIVFSLALILALLILTGVSDSDQTESSTRLNSTTTNSEVFPQTTLSEKFNYYLNLILNNSIDGQKVRSEINSLKNNFEREFLTAMMEKRSGNYEEYFKRLFALSENLPAYPLFYEELTLSAKVSDNLNAIAKLLNSNKDKSSSPYYLYLEAMYYSRSGKSSEGVERLEKLVSKGFNSKEVYFQLANGYRITGDYDKSYLNIIEAENLCEDDDPFIAKITNLKGTIFFLSGEYEKAKVEYERALKR